MLTPDKIKIAVAKVIKPHGINGELNVELLDFAEPDSDFEPGACLIVEIDGLDVPFFVSAARPRGADSCLLTLDDVNSDADAAELAGKTLYVYGSPDDISDDSLQASQLIGFEMIDAASGASIGRIDDLTELTPGAWYFNTDGRLIPAVDEFIADIDPGSRTVAMILPEGLLEL